MRRIIALVDCDSFFVACEQALHPELKHKAICVLSNNDGCIVSRSKQAKRVGVKWECPILWQKGSFQTSFMYLAI